MEMGTQAIGPGEVSPNNWLGFPHLILGEVCRAHKMLHPPRRESTCGEKMRMLPKDYFEGGFADMSTITVNWFLMAS